MKTLLAILCCLPLAPARSGMKLSTADLTFPAGRDRAFYKTEVRKWFAEHDPAAMKRLAFDELTGAFADHLAGNAGVLVADDFNHRATQFNDVCAVDDALAARRLPKPYVIAVVRNYAHRTIRDGRPLDVPSELARIVAIPSAIGTGKLTKPQTAAEVFAQWYPDAEQLKPEQRAAALARFAAANALLLPADAADPARSPTTYPPKTDLLRPTLEQLLKPVQE